MIAVGQPCDEAGHGGPGQDYSEGIWNRSTPKVSWERVVKTEDKMS